MSEEIGELNSPSRLLMIPGPCSMDPRVYRAMLNPLVGHTAPWLTERINEVQVLLRRAFQTENRITFPVAASGSGGMEAAVLSSLESGDEAIICVNGAFSDRMATIASRTAAKIIRVEAPPGRAVEPEDVLRAGRGRNIKLIGVCHGETSTGVVTQLEPFRKVADELGALLMVDAVATLVGMPLDVDRQGIDLCFSGSQKAISAPPGMAPITVGPRVEEILRTRKTPVQSWYFDLTTTLNFWREDRNYHHTPPITLLFALREALRIVFEEGLEASWKRHRRNQLALIAGLEALGLKLFVARPEDRLPTVTSLLVPSGIDDLRVREQLQAEFDIEIGRGIGDLRGKIWRVGLMGYVSQAKNILLFLGALEKVLLDHGFGAAPGTAVGAAECAYADAGV